MKETVSSYLHWGITGLAAFLLLYTGAYCFCIVRSETYAGITIPGRAYHVVGVECKLGVTGIALFRPLLNLDRRVIRRRFWSSYYEVDTETGTQRDYECDWKRTKAR